MVGADFISVTAPPKLRWVLCMDLVKSGMDMVMTAMYVKKHVSPELKDFAENMTLHIRDAFLTRVPHLDWLKNETRNNALEVVKNMTFNFSYPDEILDAEWLGRVHEVNICECSSTGIVLLYDQDFMRLLIA